MPDVSLVGVDTAGGTITGQLQSRHFEDGNPWSVIGDSVASHAPCPTPASHCAATMAEGSSGHFIDGIAVVRAGDAASCGHAATGASRWNISR